MEADSIFSGERLAKMDSLRDKYKIKFVKHLLKKLIFKVISIDIQD
ncbi:hypothetical protein JM79_2254 [Gramella sp. Hel_I_59]|nr:hypothetical protein JM79_2254 [Gramella sp. Hel_I_59]